jgi:hypothetical protein
LWRHERYVAARDARSNALEFIDKLTFDAEENDRARMLAQKFWDLRNT